VTTWIRLWEIAVPFRRPLRTARGAIDTRHSVIVAMTRDEITGWGEAPAFPSGRFGSASHAFDDLVEPSDWVGGSPNIPIASAALQAADADRSARAAGVPLHERLGASGEWMVARHPIGVRDPADVDREATWLQTHGILAVKVKISPGDDVGPILALRAAIPRLDIGVDANESYDDPNDPVFTALDDLDVSFIEQPFPAEDLDAHVGLRRRVRMAVCLDESITNMADTRRVLAIGAADQVSVKLNRLGLETLIGILDLCREAGVGVQIGGTFDTSIGRRHLLAASGLAGVVDAAVGPPSAYLADEIVPYPSLVDGMVRPDAAPGIGIEPNTAHLEEIAIRSATIEIAS
jgi:O-succinylbenzoate synthase